MHLKDKGLEWEQKKKKPETPRDHGLPLEVPSGPCDTCEGLLARIPINIHTHYLEYIASLVSLFNFFL